MSTQGVRQTQSTSAPLAADHERVLTVGSAIAPEYLAGISTVEHGRDLPPGFSRRQHRRGRGMIFEGTTLAGDVFAVYRPDDPDPDRPGLKYECQPKRRPGRKHGGPGNFLYVHESQRHLIPDTSVTAVYVEGLKKALSLLTAIRAAGVEVLIVGILGTWNWMSDGKPIPDMFEVPVEGRAVEIHFDSDLLRNPGVQGACNALAGHLIGRGASVGISYLNDRPDGSKMGDDDYFADGRTWAELQMLKRPYDPDDFAAVRLSRDDRHRARIEYLREFWRGLPATTPKECSLRDVFLVYVTEAARSGVATDDGIRVRMSQGTGRIRAKVSPKTFWKAQVALEEMGLGYRDNENRKPEQSGAFVLKTTPRAQVSKGEAEPGPGTEGHVFSVSHAPYLPPRAPRLMWSRPKWKPSRKAISEHRRGLRAWLGEPREGIARMGKIRGAVIDFLYLAGGSAKLQEIADFLARKRPRDLVRRKSTDKGRDGLLVWLIEAGIVAIDGDLVTLADAWLEALEDERHAAGEIEAEEKIRCDLSRKRDAFRAHRRGETRKPSAAGLANVKRSRERRAAYIAVAAPEPRPDPDPEIVAVLRLVLDHAPDLARKRPSWLARYLWSEELLTGRATPERIAAVELALHELDREAA